MSWGLWSRPWPWLRIRMEGWWLISDILYVERSKLLMKAACSEVPFFHFSVWLKCLQTLKEQKSGGGKGGSDVSRPIVCITVELIPRIFKIMICVSLCVWQISLSVTEELHIICFDTVFQYKDLSVPLQVQVLPLLSSLQNQRVVSNLSAGIVHRPPPSRWSSSPTPASSRAPGRLSSGSTWSARTPRSDRGLNITLALPCSAPQSAETASVSPGRHVLRQLSRRHLAAVCRDVELAVSRCRQSGAGGRAAGDDRPQTLR